MLNYKNGPPKHQCLHFYTMNIQCSMLSNIICTVFMSWWKRCSNACCGAPRWNCPISRVSTGATISIFYNEELRIQQQLLGRDGSDYCILQHRHHGCCPFVGGSRPKKAKFVSELPHFTLLYLLNCY